MRALFLQVADKLNARDRWLIGYACKWLVLILVVILYTLIVARVAFARAEKQFEAWQVEYAEGFMQHMQTVEENMPGVVDKVAEDRAGKEMMDEFWRSKTWG